MFSWVQSMVKVATLQPQFMRADDIERAVQRTITAERSEKVKEDEIIQQAQLAVAQRCGSTYGYTWLPLPCLRWDTRAPLREPSSATLYRARADIAMACLC